MAEAVGPPIGMKPVTALVQETVHLCGSRCANLHVGPREAGYTTAADHPHARGAETVMRWHRAMPVTSVSREVLQPSGTRCQHSRVDAREESIYARYMPVAASALW
jgi:hypothetical protein